MSGTATVPNTFANAVTATGAQLDANYTTIVAYLNDPTNRNNYATDGAATNTVNINFSPPVVGGYTTGLDLTFKWGATNTGGVQLNANSLGNISVVNPNGSALVAGQGQQGGIGHAVYDGTRAIYLTPPWPASAAEVSATVTLAAFVPPGRMVNHPGVAKAWGVVAQTGGTYSVVASANVASVGKAGTGTVTIVFASSLASGNYAAPITPDENTLSTMNAESKTVNSFVVRIRNTTNGNAQESGFSFVVFGSL